MQKKLNILQFICSTGFYGAERWILALARHFDPDRIRCDLAITHEAGSENLEVTRKYREDHSNIGKSFEIPMSNRFDYHAIDRLVKVVKLRDIDIIHTHGYKSDIIGVIVARRAGIKCIITPHGFENARDLKLRLFIWLGCKAMKFADSIVPLSQQIVEDVKGFGVDADRIHYIQNGVDLSEVETIYQDMSIDTCDRTIRRIGFIGQMISRKNIDDILDTFDMLASRHESIELQLLGDGDQREALETHARSLPSYNRIRFLGFREDRLEYLKSFDLFVMTSTLEGIPRCIMEAMAMGVPIVAYDIPGVDQLIKHGVTGLSAPMGDKQQLMQLWEKLLFDQQYTAKIVENARQFVQDKYSAARMSREYMDHYRQVLDPAT